MASQRLVMGCAIFLFLFVANSLQADQVILENGLNGYNGTADTTIYESTNPAIQNSNGAGQSLFAGNTRLRSTRRALVRFDLSSIPAGSQITGVSLSLRVVQTLSGASNQSLHRITTTWEPGSVDTRDPEGQGSAAQSGDATWLFNSFNTSSWASAGGDFVPGPSATAQASLGATVVWSGAQMIQDVQDWIDGTAQNFGWILIGNESGIQTAFRYNSSEGGTVGTRPKLTIDFDPPPPVSTVLSNQTEFVAYIEGTQAGTPSTALGTGRFSLDTDANTLSYEIRWGGFASAELFSHIHGPAEPGTPAGIKHDLPLGSVKTGVWNYDETDEADILAGRMYVNIHSNDFTAGEIRGQIVNMVSVLDGAQAATASTAGGIGNYIINTNENKLGYHIAFTLVGTETMAHIHGFSLHTRGSGVQHTLPATNPKVGVWDYPDADEKKILDGLTYANIHSDIATPGEIRGQITRFVTTTDGDQASVATSAIGTGLVSLDTANNELGYHIVFQGLSSAELFSHIHGPARPGVDAGIRHDLPAGSPKLGIWNYDDALERAVRFSRTYVNIHSENNPQGEIRGQVWTEALQPASARGRWMYYD